jgi:hypothetical protein
VQIDSSLMVQLTEILIILMTLLAQQLLVPLLAATISQAAGCHNT